MHPAPTLLSECSEARITHLHTLIGIPVTQFRPQACHESKDRTWGTVIYQTLMLSGSVEREGVRDAPTFKSGSSGLNCRPP